MVVGDPQARGGGGGEGEGQRQAEDQGQEGGKAAERAQGHDGLRGIQVAGGDVAAERRGVAPQDPDPDGLAPHRTVFSTTTASGFFVPLLAKPISSIPESEVVVTGTPPVERIASSSPKPWLVTSPRASKAFGLSRIAQS